MADRIISIVCPSCLDEVYEGLEMGDEIGTEILRIQRKVLAQTKKQVERRKVYG